MLIRGEASTLLRDRLEIRLDENLDVLFVRINLGTNRPVAKVDLVPSSVRGSNDGVRHFHLALGSGTMQSVNQAEETWSSG
jgi:hypothetical protein